MRSPGVPGNLPISTPGVTMSRVCGDEKCEKDHTFDAEKALTRGAIFWYTEGGETGLAGHTPRILFLRRYGNFIFSPPMGIISFFPFQFSTISSRMVKWVSDLTRNR